MWNALFKVAVASLVLMAVVFVFILYRKPLKERDVLLARKAALEKIVADQRTRFDGLKLRQEKLQTDPRFVEKLAREEFGYARPGEVVFKFEGDASAARKN